MSRIFWDTNLFIYLFEAYGELSKRTVELRSRMLARGDQLLTSALTVGELLVKPMEKGDTALCRKYEQVITATALVLSFGMAFLISMEERPLKGPSTQSQAAPTAPATPIPAE